MKALKIGLWVLAGIVLLAAVAVGLALTPGVQRWALHRAVAGVPGLTLETERVVVRPSRVELTGVVVTHAGTTARVPSLSADVDLWRFWRTNELVVARLEARGFDVALAATDAPAPATAGSGPVRVETSAAPTGSAARPAASGSAGSVGSTVAGAPSGAAKPPAFAGVLAPIELPFPLTLGRVDLQGTVRFAGPSAAIAPSATLEFQGAGFAPGGKFDGTLKVAVRHPVPGSDVQTLTLDGKLGVTVTTDRRLSAVELAALVSAQADGSPNERRLQLGLRVAQAAAGAGEQLALTIDLPRDGAAATRLAGLTATFAPARGVIAGEWTLEARRAQLADFIRGRELPDFDGSSSGKFSFSPATGDASADGRLAVALGSLAGVRAELAALGAVRLETTFAAARQGDTIRLDRLETVLAQGRAEVLRVKSLQPAAYDLKTANVAFAQPQSDLVQIEVAGLPVAWLRPFLAGVELEGREIVGSFAVGAAADGSRVALRALQPLTFDGLTLKQGGRTWLDRARITLSPRVEHSAEGTTALVPDFVVAMAGGDQFELHCDLRASGEGEARTLGFAAALKAKVPTLLKAVLPANSGGLQGDVKIAGALRGHELALQTANLLAKRGNGLALAEIETRQPFTFFLDSLTVRPEQAGQPLARVVLSGLPLEWLRPWLDGWQVSGDLAGAEVLVQTDGTANVALETVRPFAFRDLRVAQDGKLFLEDIEGELALKARGSRERVQIDTVSMDLRRGADSLLRLAGSFDVFNGGDFRLDGQGRFDADAVRLLALPPLQPYATLAHGRVSGDGEFSAGTKPRAKLNLRGRELVGREGGVAWGDVALSLDLATAQDGTMNFKLPVTVGNVGRKSELLVAGSARAANGAFTANAALTGEHLYFDDLTALATMARGRPAEPSTAPVPAPGNGGAAPRPATGPAAPKGRDAQPVWQGVTGRVDVDVKTITGEQYEITGLKTALVVTPERVALEKLEGKFKDAPLTATGALTFRPTGALAYALEGAGNFPGFDIGAFLRATDPKTPPVLDTVATVKAAAKSGGARLDDTLAATRGTFELTADKGVYRGLARAADKVSMGTALLGMLSRNEKLERATATVAEIADALREIPFEKLVVRSERGDDLRVLVKEFALIGTEVRLLGGGVIEADPAVPFVKQRQRLELALAFRGERAKRWAADYSLFNPEPDAAGFYALKSPLVLTGTLLEPNSKDFYASLAQSLLVTALRAKYGAE